MITPSIGRVMWYWPSKEERQDQPRAAIVTWVCNDNMVNLVAFDQGGAPSGKGLVPIVQDGSPYTAGDSPYAEWLPYRSGQVKKHAEEMK